MIWEWGRRKRRERRKRGKRKREREEEELKVKKGAVLANILSNGTTNEKSNTLNMLEHFYSKLRYEVLCVVGLSPFLKHMDLRYVILLFYIFLLLILLLKCDFE